MCREDLLGVVEADQRVFLVRPGCGSFRIPRDKPPPLPAHEVPLPPCRAGPHHRRSRWQVGGNVCGKQRVAPIEGMDTM